MDVCPVLITRAEGSAAVPSLWVLNWSSTSCAPGLLVRAGRDIGREVGWTARGASDLGGAAWLSARCGRWWLKCVTYWPALRCDGGGDDEDPV
jgi:hypothetical protein